MKHLRPEQSVTIVQSDRWNTEVFFSKMSLKMIKSKLIRVFKSYISRDRNNNNNNNYS